MNDPSSKIWLIPSPGIRRTLSSSTVNNFVRKTGLIQIQDSLQSRVWFRVRRCSAIAAKKAVVETVQLQKPPWFLPDRTLTLPQTLWLLPRKTIFWKVYTARMVSLQRVCEFGWHCLTPTLLGKQKQPKRSCYLPQASSWKSYMCIGNLPQKSLSKHHNYGLIL